MRFTKVLTKYSTEYNNYLFIQNLCFTLGMDQKDLFAFFNDLRNEKSEDEIYILLENYEISKLDISRMFRYLDKYSCIVSNDSNDSNDANDDDSVNNNV